MSIPAINWCISRKGLPPAEWVVLFHLCHAHNQELGCFPSQEFLSEQTGMSPRSMVRHMASLEAQGLLLRERRYEGNIRISDRYWFPFEEGFESVGANLARANSCIGRCQMVHTQVPTVASTYEQEVTGIEQEEPPVSPPKKRPPPKARLPDGWVLPDECREYALSKNLTNDEIEELANDFHAYWTDRADKNARKSERGWAQTWRNRVNDRLIVIFRNRRVSQQTQSIGFGQDGSLASVLAQRRAGSEN